MKERFKKMLQKLGVYHPLQRSYRSSLGWVRLQFYKFSYRQYKGRGYTCNFCYAQYEKFIPEYPSAAIKEAIDSNKVIAGFGDNVYCPNCYSKNRDRLVKAVLENYIDTAGKQILHFSPEKNIYNYLRGKAMVTTADLLPGFYKSVDRQVQFADATQLGWVADSFDIVIANHIMEHIPDDNKAMKEIYRVLKPGGVAILQVPYSEVLQKTIEDPHINNPKDQEKLFGQKDHVRIYALQDYLDRLIMAGFTLEIIGDTKLEHYKKFAIQDGEKVILARKRQH